MKSNHIVNHPVPFFFQLAHELIHMFKDRMNLPDVSLQLIEWVVVLPLVQHLLLIPITVGGIEIRSGVLRHYL